MGWLLRVERITIVGLTLVFGFANADCMMNRKGEAFCGKGQCERDQNGTVFCSAFRNGSAVRTIHGKVLCAKGDCIKTLSGKVYCSTVPEGGAMKDIRGIPRCEGQCELALPEYCEARPAGTVPK